jgi:hypothetical protein
MSNTIDKIRGLLNLPELRKFYAEAKLDDGRLVVTEADAMAIGVEVKVMGEDGTAEDLADGNYNLEDGTLLVIQDGRIAQLGEEEPAAEEAPAEEAPAEAELAKDDKLTEELKALELEDDMIEKVAAVVRALYEKEEEEMAAQATEDTEVLEAFAAEVQAAFDVVLSRLENIENAPASNGVAYSPKKNNPEPVALSARNPQQRAHQLIQRFQA